MHAPRSLQTGVGRSRCIAGGPLRPERTRNLFLLGHHPPGPLQLRRVRDTQLGGAIVVEPREGSPADRVFVISTFGEPPPHCSLDRRKSDVFAINGSSWPHTERLHHKVGDRVRWRIINLSFTPHPMHLHGFYFAVEATGDIGARTAACPGPATHGRYRIRSTWSARS